MARLGRLTLEGRTCERDRVEGQGHLAVQCAINRKLSACSFDRELYDGSRAATLRTAVKGMKGVEFVDLFEAICPLERCPAVIGNVLIYRKGSHITATYIKTLTPRLAKALTKAHLHATYRKEGT